MVRLSGVALFPLLAHVGWGQRVIDFEDLTTQSEGDPVTNQYTASDNILFGMMGIYTSSAQAGPAGGNAPLQDQALDCPRLGDAGCYVWFTDKNADEATVDSLDLSEKPLLVEVGGSQGGFIGGDPSAFCDLNDGQPLSASPSPYVVDMCDACCSSCTGDIDCVQNADWPFPDQGVGSHFLTNSLGLSTPASIGVFGIYYTAGGSSVLGGTILDVDCNDNFPQRVVGGVDPGQNKDFCEAWLVRGWANRADADAYFRDPNNPTSAPLDHQFVSAVPRNRIQNASADRYVEACNAARTGASCPVDASGVYDTTDPTCCPLNKAKCGIRARPWCYLTEYFPANGGRVGVTPGAGDSRSTNFGLQAPNGLTMEFVTVEWAGTKSGQSVGLAFDNFYVDSLLTLEPTPAPTPMTTGAPATSVVRGDPHFFDFAGGRFDVMGEADKIYNIISDVNLQVNSRFVAGTTSHKTTFLGEVGVMVGRQTLSMDPVSCSAVLNEDVELTPGLGLYELDGASVTLGRATISLHTPSFDIDFGCFAKRQAPHFNMAVAYHASESSERLPHGILGQTSDMKPRQRKGQQGEGAIEGVYGDYEVSSMFGTDFAYNRFEYAPGQAQVL